MYVGQTKKKDTFAIELTSSRAVGRSENSGGARVNMICQNLEGGGSTPKGQIISKANLKFSFEPKIERQYFSISALGL